MASCLQMSPSMTLELSKQLRRAEDNLMEQARPGLQALDRQWQQQAPHSLEAQSVAFVAFTVRLAIRDIPLKQRAWGFLEYAARIEHLAPGLQGHPDWQEYSRWVLHTADAVRAKVLKIREDATHLADSMAEAQMPQLKEMHASMADIRRLLQQLQRAPAAATAAEPAAANPAEPAAAAAATPAQPAAPTTPPRPTPLMPAAMPTTPPPAGPPSLPPAPGPQQQAFVPLPRTRTFPGRYYSMQAVWRQVVEVSKVRTRTSSSDVWTLGGSPAHCNHITCISFSLCLCLQDQGKRLNEAELKHLRRVRRPVALLIFAVSQQSVVLRGKRLEEPDFLAALQHCERDAVKRAALTRTLDYLDRVMKDFIE